MDDNRFERGRKNRADAVGGDIVDLVFQRSGPVEMEAQKLFTAHAWGEVFDRPGLGRNVRLLINVATLAILGERETLKHHVRAAVRNGCTTEEIREAIIQAGSLAGPIRAVLGCRAADEALTETPKLARATSS
jgi:alkylhydroperoxidase/carboxymuconolactone decarboxylase family protein YurZ